MKDWFKVKKKDVIDLVIKKKDRSPWYIRPDEKYRCLVFWDDGMLRMTVDQFYEVDSETYECCLYYTTIVAKSLEEYNNLTEDGFVSKAYNAWCTGAR